jgi:hypothetical protein
MLDAVFSGDDNIIGQLYKKSVLDYAGPLV